jgi:apolipoprotein N-acyltransferase
MWRARLARVFCALAGAVFALAAPPTDVYPALWIGMAALAWALGTFEPAERASRPRILLDGVGRGVAFGVGANVVALRFVPDVIAHFTPLPKAAGVLALLLLAGFEALRWGVAGIVCRTSMRFGAPMPAAFAVGVFTGTFVDTVFPWTAAGGVTPCPAMVQLAEVVGERGVTFVMALTAGFAGEAVRALRASARRRALVSAAVAVVLPLATYAQGAVRMRRIEARRASAPTVKVGLVEPSIGALERWDPSAAPAILDNLTALSKSAEKRGAELTVWPEAAYPYPLVHDATRAPTGRLTLPPFGVRGPILTGVILESPDQVETNSAALFSADGTRSVSQDKVHLLWFGETVPLADRWPWIGRVFARGTGMVPGKAFVPIVSGRVRAAVLNCFEDILPLAGRQAMTVAPNLLVNVSNDAWFVGSPESELHLRLAVLRAVESRRDLVRAVNYGPTSFVDATGRIRARSDVRFASALVVDAKLLDTGRTIYGLAGDAPLALVCIAAFVFFAVRARRASRDAPP